MFFYIIDKILLVNFFVMIYAILFVLIGMVFAGVANTLMRGLSKDNEKGGFDIYTDLLLQHGSISISAILFAVIVGGVSLHFTFSGFDRLILLGMMILGYAGIFFFLKSMETLSASVALIIASCHFIVGYPINLYFFPEQESLSMIKVFFALLFFVIMIFFILISNNTAKKRFRFNWCLLYPVITALCRGFFFNMINYFIKSDLMNPYQVVVVSESVVFLGALIVFLIVHKGDTTSLLKMKVSHLKPYVMIGLSIVLASFFVGMSLTELPGNVVNVMRLFAIIVAAILGYFWYGDKLTRKQLKLMILSGLVLVAFVLL